MLSVLRNSWALLMGVMLLMVGNGMQGTLLGVRGEIEQFSTFSMALVMAGYSLGMLIGGRVVPGMLRRVGHVRVFAALGSTVSAVLIAYPALPEWQLWVVMRVLMGFSFAGVYITAESWLNDASSNETRGQALSAYMIVQMLGIIGAQFLMNIGDPAGYFLFVVPSVLVSIAFTPILLTVSEAPKFETTKPLSFRQLFRISPLGCVGMFVMGAVFSALFAMVSVWGARVGLSVRDLSTFIAAIYVGGLVFQYPIGFASDRIDRRRMILGLSALGAVVTLLAAVASLPYWAMLVVAVIAGGVANPLYSLLIAYTNDYMDRSDMAAASGGLLSISGIGAVGGPVVIAWLMDLVGPGGFFLFVAVLFAMLAAYAGWRMTRRGARAQGAGYSVISPVASSVAVSETVVTSEAVGQGQDDAGQFK